MLGRKKETVSETAVLEALRQVIDPDLKQDLVSLGFVKNINICGGTVSFDVELTTPACPLKDVLKSAAEQAVLALPDVEQVEVRMTAQVRAGRRENRPPIPGVKNSIAVASGKGGVGKSTVAVNLAVALAQTGARTGLLDADIYGPSIPIMFGLNGPPTMTDQEELRPLSRFDVKLMSIGFLMREEGAPVIWRGPLVGRMIKEFLSRVVWGELDYLLLDLPPGTGDAQLTLVQSAPLSGAVIVTTPQAVALEDVVRALRMFQRVEVPVLGILENMSYYECPHCHHRAEIFSHGGGREAAQQLGVPFLGEIPIDPQIRSGGDQGAPLVAAHPDSPQAQAFRDIASKLAAHLSRMNLRERENHVRARFL